LVFSVVSSFVVAKPERRRLLGIPRHSSLNNIKMNLREVGWGGVDWITWLRIGTGGRLLDNGN
jgi:hypothetical protein